MAIWVPTGHGAYETHIDDHELRAWEVSPGNWAWQHNVRGQRVSRGSGSDLADAQRGAETSVEDYVMGGLQ
jgi:hypothetical protein